MCILVESTVHSPFYLYRRSQELRICKIKGKLVLGEFWLHFDFIVLCESPLQVQQIAPSRPPLFLFIVIFQCVCIHTCIHMHMLSIELFPNQRKVRVKWQVLVKRPLNLNTAFPKCHWIKVLTINHQINLFLCNVLGKQFSQLNVMERTFTQPTKGTDLFKAQICLCPSCNSWFQKRCFQPPITKSISICENSPPYCREKITLIICCKIPCHQMLLCQKYLESNIATC